jgi:hypothetical protein
LCRLCDPNYYYFAPEFYDESEGYACNEIINRNNVAVNELKRNTCAEYTEMVGQVDDWDLGRDYDPGVHECLPYEIEDLKLHCAENQLTATHVDELDPYGYINENDPFILNECVVNYCEDNFDPNWSTDGDSAGCLETICQDDQLCRDMFLTHDGDPLWYLREDEVNKCKSDYLDCVQEVDSIDPLHFPEAGAPITRQQCFDRFEMCQSNLIFAQSLHWRTESKFVNIYMETLDSFANSSKKFIKNAYENHVNELKVRIENNKGIISEEIKRDMLTLMSYPESMAFEFQRDPASFVKYFGEMGEDYENMFEHIIGPNYQVAKEGWIK